MPTTTRRFYEDGTLSYCSGHFCCPTCGKKGGIWSRVSWPTRQAVTEWEDSDCMDRLTQKAGLWTSLELLRPLKVAWDSDGAEIYLRNGEIVRSRSLEEAIRKQIRAAMEGEK